MEGGGREWCAVRGEDGEALGDRGHCVGGCFGRDEDSGVEPHGWFDAQIGCQGGRMARCVSEIQTVQTVLLSLRNPRSGVMRWWQVRRKCERREDLDSEVSSKHRCSCMSVSVTSRGSSFHGHAMTREAGARPRATTALSGFQRIDRRSTACRSYIFGGEGAEEMGVGTCTHH